ncbi:MAG: aspartate carbamoyltransferase catalytic subunit [Candidatus Omnitrophica bacterium]|nr:aspartate carbamoyltransferase catalytic subunit [Candidatus Omnitrophota bacterium]MBD3268739.1 aspartate carbamoyltransferase catalytic subunit [Candidatus Omnitrophota bacterium]
MKEWDKKHILGIKDLSKEELEAVFSLTHSFKEISQREVKKVPALRGKTIVNLFFENSTRTRISFELAAKRLSADVVNFSSTSSSLTKGETIIDTLKNLESYHPDIMIMRINSSACLELFTRYTQASIINAGDGRNEHPTQALLDMYTAREMKGKLEALKVVIVGDILHSRVARSNIFGFRKFSSSVTVCAPPTLIPYGFENMGVDICYDLDKVIDKADIIIFLRIQRERQEAVFFPNLREYVERFSLTPQRAEKLKKDCLVMHPGPVNWDIEISSSLKEKMHPLILKQAENGLAVRMAILYLVGTRKRQID